MPDEHPETRADDTPTFRMFELNNSRGGYTRSNPSDDQEQGSMKGWRADHLSIALYSWGVTQGLKEMTTKGVDSQGKANKTTLQSALGVTLMMTDHLKSTFKIEERNSPEPSPVLTPSVNEDEANDFSSIVKRLEPCHQALATVRNPKELKDCVTQYHRVATEVTDHLRKMLGLESQADTATSAAL